MGDELRSGDKRLDEELSHALETAPGTLDQRLNRRVHDRLIAGLKPVTPVPPPWVCFAGLLSILVILEAVLIPITGTAGVEKMSGVQAASVSFLFLAGDLLFAFLLTRQFAPALPYSINTPLTVSILALLVFAGTAVLFPWSDIGTEWTESWQCLVRIAAFAALTATLLALPMRRAARLSRAAQGATLGAAAGLTGVAIQQFACVYQNASHLLVWHWSGIAITAAVGSLIGRVSDRGDSAGPINSDS